jgi:hypothetical protein
VITHIGWCRLFQLLNADPCVLGIGYGSGVKWRVLVWAAVLIAAGAAITLGVIAVTSGLTASSGLAGFIVGFCELLAVTLAVIGWAGQHRPSADEEKEKTSASVSSSGQPDAGQGLAPGRSGVKYAVTLGNSARGVMIGDSNVQNIDFSYSQRDPRDPEAKESG